VLVDFAYALTFKAASRASYRSAYNWVLTSTAGLFSETQTHQPVTHF